MKMLVQFEAPGLSRDDYEGAADFMHDVIEGRVPGDFTVLGTCNDGSDCWEWADGVTYVHVYPGQP